MAPLIPLPKEFEGEFYAATVSGGASLLTTFLNEANQLGWDYVDRTPITTNGHTSGYNVLLVKRYVV